MSNNSQTLKKKLSAFEFHSYLDGQSSEKDFAVVEKALEKNPKVILRLQQCMMINERFQELYGEPVTDPIANNNRADVRPLAREPELVSSEFDDPYADNDALSALDSFDVDSDEQEFFTEEYISDAEEHATYTEQENDDEYTEEYSSEQLDYEESQMADEEPINVENLLQGISDIEALSERQGDALATENYGIEIYSQPDRGRISAFFHNLLEHFRSKIGLYKYKIQQKVQSRKLRMAEAAAEKAAEKRANQELNEAMADFDIDIDHAFQDTPKWKLWSDRVADVKDEAVNSVRDSIDPFAPTIAPWYSRMTNAGQRTFSALQVPKGRQGLILGIVVLLAGVVLGRIITSSPIEMNAYSVSQQAISSHNYYSSKGFLPLKNGLEDLEDDLQLMEKSNGLPLKLFNLKGTNFKRKGAILLPSVNGYASFQLLENKKKQTISLYSTLWEDPTLDESQVSCRVPTGISSVCVWHKNAFFHVLASEISLSRVRKLAEKFAAQ